MNATGVVPGETDFIGAMSMKMGTNKKRVRPSSAQVRQPQYDLVTKIKHRNYNKNQPVLKTSFRPMSARKKGRSARVSYQRAMVDPYHSPRRTYR